MATVFLYWEIQGFLEKICSKRKGKWEKAAPQLLWAHQKWSLIQSIPNLPMTQYQGTIEGIMVFTSYVSQSTPKCMWIEPCRLSIHLQSFHLIPQSCVQGKEGIQGGSLPSPLVLLFNRHCLFLFSNIKTSQIATKDLLVFNTAMSFTCPVKLKSLWRWTSVTWSSLVSRI